MGALSASRKHPWPELSDFLERLKSGKFSVRNNRPAETFQKQTQSVKLVFPATGINMQHANKLSNQFLKPNSFFKHNSDGKSEPLCSNSGTCMEEMLESKSAWSTMGKTLTEDFLGNPKGEFSDQLASSPVEDYASVAEISKCIVLFLDVSIWEPLTENLLKQKRVKLTPYLVSEVLRQQKDVDKALGFLNWAIQRKGYVGDPQTLVIMIMQLEKAKRYADIWFLLEDMSHGHLRLTASTLTKIIDSFATAESTREIVDSFKSIKLSGSALSSLPCACFLAILLKTGQVNEACKYAEEILSIGLNLDVSAHNFLICKFCKEGKWDVACNFINQLFQKGRLPDENFYSALFMNLMEEGQSDAAFRLSMMAIKEDYIDVNSCNTFLDGLAKRSHLDLSCKLFQIMRRRHCKPNLITYNLLIDHLGKVKRVIEACNVFHLIKRDGLMPDATSYLALIKVLGMNGKVKLAHRYFQDLKLLVGKPSATAYACLMDGYGRAGKESEVLKMYDEMKENEVHPDVVVYSTLFRILGRARNVVAANRLLGEMKFKKCEPDLQTYNQIMDCFGRNGWIQKAFDVFGEMKRKGMLPDTVTYSVLINSLGNKGEALKAFELLKEMISEGFWPNLITYNSMIKALARREHYDLAFQLYEEMPIHGCQPDAITFSILLDMCTAHCDEKRTAKLYSDFKATGVTPDKPMMKSLYKSMQFLQQQAHIYLPL